MIRGDIGVAAGYMPPGRCRCQDGTVQRSRVSEVRALAVTWLTTIVTVLAVWLRNERFFYRDDVEHQMIGAFTAMHRAGWTVGSLLGFRSSWALSLLVGETQFGVFNPFSPLRNAVAAMGDNLALNAMLIALGYLLLAATGTYAAARALGTSQQYSAVAALFCTFNVHLLYWNAGSWTPALIGFAWFTWFAAAVWWTRRNIRFVVLVPVAGFLLVTAGWPHAMIVGGVLALAVGIQQLAERSWGTREAVAYTVACVTTALLSAPTWMTARAFSPFAARFPQGVSNDGFLTHHLDALLLNWSPFNQPYLDGFAGNGFYFEPITYVAWFLPLAAWWLCTLPAARRALRTDLLVAAVTSVAMLGPSTLGPVRWPFRFQPFAAFLLVLVACRVLDIARSSDEPAARFRRVWVWVAPVALLAFSALRPRIVPMLLTLALLVAVWFAHRLHRSARQRLLAPLLGLSVVATTMYLVTASPSPAVPGDRNTPSSRAAITAQYPALRNQRVLVLQSNLSAAQKIKKKEGRITLVGNWGGAVTAAEMADGNVLLGSDLGVELINGYSAMPHKALENLLETRVFGWATDRSAAALFAREPVTGARWLELLGVSRLMVQKGRNADWLAAARPADVTLTVVDESEDWTVYDTGFAATAGTPAVTWRNGDSTVWSVPVVPGLRVTVNGRVVEYRTLDGVVPMFEAPPGATVRFANDLPDRNAIAVMMLLGAALLAWLAVRSLRPGRDARTAPTGPTPTPTPT